MAQPIWKDYLFNIGGIQSIGFTLSINGVLAYSGNAYRKPGESNLRVNLNDVIADYLSTKMPKFDKSDFIDVADKFVEDDTMQVVASVNDEYEFIGEEIFQNDYSFGLPRPYPFVASQTNFIDRRQPLIVSIYGGDGAPEAVNYAIVMKNGISFIGTFYTEGKSGAMIIPSTILSNAQRIVFYTEADDFNEDYNQDFLASENTFPTVIVGDTCARFALYFVNPWGGWDSIPMAGEYSRNDDITRHMMTSVYDNSDISARGRRNYANHVARTYSLNSGWLHEEQAEKFTQLLSSTNVYLYDMVDDTMQAVTIAEKSSPLKTFKNQGGKLINYQVDVTLSQERTIR